MTQLDSARIGTAGYTAALCVEALVRDGIKPTDGEIIVSGATGGVGSVAVALLANMGYSVNIIIVGFRIFKLHIEIMGEYKFCIGGSYERKTRKRIS